MADERYLESERQYMVGERVTITGTAYRVTCVRWSGSNPRANQLVYMEDPEDADHKVACVCWARVREWRHSLWRWVVVTPEMHGTDVAESHAFCGMEGTT